MKTIYLIVTLLLPVSLFSQMKINAGNDTTFCSSCIPDGTVRLGTTMRIENGTPPYTYKWTTKLNLFSNSYFYAKTFLNDTTVANPIVVEPSFSQKWYPFYLEVTDARQQHARDTILVRFSGFGYVMSEQIYFASIGDEILMEGGGFGGGILPYKSYRWSPTTGLSNPDSLITKCKVTEVIDYTLTFADSVGCVGSVRVKVRTATGINQNKVDIVPYQRGNALIWANSNHVPVRIIFYKTDGHKIKDIEVRTDRYTYDEKLNDKIFFYHLVIGHKIYSGKFINLKN